MATAKTKRLEARVTAELKELVERAAETAGLTVSDFIVSTLQPAAEKTIRNRYILELTERGTEAFVEALLSPPEPGERLRAAARDYQEFVDRK